MVRVLDPLARLLEIEQRERIACLRLEEGSLTCQIFYKPLHGVFIGPFSAKRFPLCAVGEIPQITSGRNHHLSLETASFFAIWVMFCNRPKTIFLLIVLVRTAGVTVMTGQIVGSPAWPTLQRFLQSEVCFFGCFFVFSPENYSMTSYGDHRSNVFDETVLENRLPFFQASWAKLGLLFRSN